MLTFTTDSKIVNICSDNNKYKYKIPQFTNINNLIGIKLYTVNYFIKSINIILRNRTIYSTSDFEQLKNINLLYNCLEPMEIEFVFNKEYLYDNETYETIPEIIEEYGEIVEIYDEIDGRYYNGNIVTRKDTGNTQRIITKGAEIVVPKFKIYFE